MSEDGTDLRFDSPEKEIKHWKSKVADMQDALRETESSLQDFMESSKELESEMEKELNTSNKTISDLKRRNDQLTGDLEDWKSKYSRALSEHNSTLTNLQKELALLRESVDVYKAKLRDTELTNDELENAERMIASSLADMEGKYNKTIEKTALLEEELIEKTRLEEENQRLKDELREMTEEMTVLRDVVTSSRAVSRVDTMASSTFDDAPVPRSDQSFDSSPRKPSAASSAAAAERPSSRQALSSPSLNRVPISRRLGAMGHNRRLSRDVRAAEASGLAAVQDSSPADRTTSAAAAPPTRASTLSRRDTLAGTPSHHAHSSSSHTHGLTSSPSARAQLRASVRAAARMGGGVPSTPRSTIPANGAAGSKRMMAEMISKMKALETRINTAKDLSRVVGPGDESAIPRPSSRMATLGSPSANGFNSIPMPVSTPRAPRASMDGNRTIGSSIPVPSRVRRPSSRMSERGTPPMPSLGLPRSQTPSGLHARGSSRGGSSPLPPHEFMDHDPASTLPHVARYAAAQAAFNSSASAAKRRSSTSGMTHSASYGSLAKTRSGSTLPRSTTPSTVAAPRVTQSMMTHYADSTTRTPLSTRLASSHRTASSMRGSVNGPPSSWKSSGVAAASTLTRSRSGSFGSQPDA
ncbi:related to nuclear distribution protein RO11 [Sporisorium scitamineum]|uniref:Related to nuclear distribution protein RO11 n=1 Tax=Sporisorium scitamineum TaxID=49012 RepID=A0A0F7S7H9_9BASI|nr:related to nuclear distribution protein RO11 [Sporisorium scitamineum]CDW98286.1 hypothetical protein [Sporisorium scitamineum]